MQQYREIKARHQNAILFFRMGDFYEMFFDDAELGARVLNITLTARGDGVPLAGVPVKAAADYLRQLVAAGHRVAICEQVEDPRSARGIVKRAVVETVTPGALLEENWLAGGRNNWIVAVLPEGDRQGLAAIDLSTGEFVLETLAADALAEALARLAPAEIVLPGDAAPPLEDGVLLSTRERWEFDADLAADDLRRRFSLASLDGLGVGDGDSAALGAAGALLRYLADLQPGGLPHLNRPSVRRSDACLWLDEMTRRNLELVEPLRAGARNCTLLESIDATVTPMGARLLRHWLLSPLRDPAAINERLDAVAVAVADARGRARVREALDGVRDLERLAGRAAAGRATPRELGALRDSFRRLPDVLESLTSLAGRERSAALAGVEREFDLLADLAAELGAALEERLPAVLADGAVIRAGYDAELDELRTLRDGGKHYIAGLQQRERERTGISSLKVGFNRVFGYYLEITNAHASRVPAEYERRQTLAGAERYVTPELKDYEARVLGAEERMAVREGELFGALRAAVGIAVDRVQRTARALARLDVLGRAGRARAVTGALRPARSRRRLRARASRVPPPGHRAPDAARVVHPQRRAVRPRPSGCAGDRAQHGRQVHDPAPDRAVRGAGADRLVRARGRGAHRRRRPALHPRRRERQPRARPVHLHGGDERDQRHSPQREPRGAWCCSTRSAAAPPPTTAWPSPGR